MFGSGPPGDSVDYAGNLLGGGILAMLKGGILSAMLFAQGLEPVDGATRWEGMEQIFGLLGDVSLSGNFGEGSPFLYETDLLLAGAQGGSMLGASGQSILFAAAGSYNSLGYRLDPHHAFHLGYGFQHVLPPLAGQPTNENRGFQQYTFDETTPYGDLKLSSRLEERTVNIESGLALRVRQQFQFTRPLTPEWYLVGIDEVYFNLNTVSWGPATGFDQNRLFLGFGYHFTPEIRGEIGYMNNYINRDLVDDLDVDFLVMNFYVDLTR